MKRPTRTGVAWLEVLLVLAIVALVLQLFPALWWRLVALVDVRHWSRWTWFFVNLAVVAVLFGVRMAPEWSEAVARRRADKAKRRQQEERKRRAEERRERAASRSRIRW